MRNEETIPGRDQLEKPRLVLVGAGYAHVSRPLSGLCRFEPAHFSLLLISYKSSKPYLGDQRVPFKVLR